MKRNPYNDILYMERPVSEKHPPMPMAERAAQFSPFMALTGYDDALSETARTTEQRRELTEEEKQTLDRKQALLAAHIEECPFLSVTYFVPDSRKDGGEYRTVVGTLKKIDEVYHRLTFSDGTQIFMKDITDMEAELFGFLEDTG